jgi:hypothetical protein
MQLLWCLDAGSSERQRRAGEYIEGHLHSELRSGSRHFERKTGGRIAGEIATAVLTEDGCLENECKF